MTRCLPMPRGCLRAVMAAALAFTLATAVRAQDDQPPAMNFAALEAAGVRIGEISVRAEDIFDTADAREDNGLFRLAYGLTANSSATTPTTPNTARPWQPQSAEKSLAMHLAAKRRQHSASSTYMLRKDCAARCASAAPG
jgi:hypothetical protein